VLAVMAFIIAFETKSSLGLDIGIPIMHYCLAIFALARSMSTDMKLAIWEYCLFIFAYLIQYGWGIANLFISYKSEDFKKADSSHEASVGEYIVLQIFLIPLITSIISSIYKWIDDKY